MAKTKIAGTPVGTVTAFAGATVPAGTLLCDGSAVSRTVYASLFAQIGTTYGSGDGSTTFNLPDYRGMFLRGRVDVTSVTGSGTAISNQATFNGHGFRRTGFRVRLTSGTLSGLAANIDYYVIVVDANTLAFATSPANALSNTRVVISGANSAVIAQWVSPDQGSNVAVAPGGNSGNNVGSMQEDAIQGHGHEAWGTNGAGAVGAAFGANAGNLNNNIVRAPITTGAFGSPRATSETRPMNLTVNYCITFV